MNRFMIRQVAGCAIVLASVIAVIAIAADPPAPPPRTAMWKKVDEAIGKGLPQTAIKELDPIIESAIKDKAYPEAIKAICKKIAYEGNIQGNKPEEKITRMKAEIAKAPKEMVPMMDAILANWYWHYFQQNRWRFQQRTATAAAPSNDFTTWDLPRLFSEIDQQFTKALAAEKELKTIPIATFDALLEKGTVPDTYRPTLFDFIAFEALNFYTAGEQAGAKAEDTFEFAATSPVLGSIDEFLKWQPTTTDTDSTKLKAIKLYQNLLSFHKDDKSKDAYLDADLFRLQFGHAHAFGDEKATRYKAALKAFAEEWADHELSAMARHRWAERLHAEGESVEARKVALQGKNAFPNSNGGKMCHNLILQIEDKSVQVLTERVWNDPLPVLRVQYRNIAKVYFRAVKLDWTERLMTKNRWRPDQLVEKDYNELTKLKPELEWNADLVPTDDYQQRTQDVPAPKGLKPGFYVVLCSWNEQFTDADNNISMTDVWVSDLALVIRNQNNSGKVDGFVLTAKGGDPIPNAKVRHWVRNPQNNTFSEGAAVSTDANGFFSIAGPNQRGIFLLASHNGHEISSQGEHYLYQYPNRYVPRAQTVLFTDRSLYRPGQTIQFKGITLLADTEKDDYKTLPGRKLTVVLRDPNGKEVAKTVVTSNDFGSFSGNFTAPRDTLMGPMHLAIPNEPGGIVQFHVEEYKRPKFQVAIDAPKEAPKLNGVVTMIGKATAYTGAPINSAKVRWRVAREVRWPVWFYDCFWWRLPPHRGAAQEIAHGTATTEADGTFTVTFTAKPDLTVPEKDEPTFHYTLYADVTDTTGETRSASQNTTVGYTALQANLTAEEWLTVEKDVILKLTTTTLDGEGQAAKGAVKIHKLKAPETVQRPDILGQVSMPRRGRGIALPNPRPDSNDIRTWALGDLVKSSDFATEKDGKKELPFKLEAGAFRAILETQDRFGKPVTAQLNIRVLNPNDTKFALKIPQLLAAPTWSLEPGNEFQAIWGTGYERGRAFVEVEHRGKMLQSFWTDPEKTQIGIKQAVDEAMRGGFTVRTTFVRENRGYIESRRVDVPWSNKDLTIKWERFVSKLEPAKKETFTAVISGPKAAKTVAEMVAALYDASLDAYKPHNWLRKFNVFRTDHSRVSSYFDNNAKYFNHFRGHWSPSYAHVDLRYRQLPYDLTVNLWGYMYFGRGGGLGGAPGGPMAGAAPMAAEAKSARRSEDLETEQLRKNANGLDAQAEGFDLRNRAAEKQQDKEAGAGGSPGPDLNKVAARKNLNETAFFFPHLVAGDDGTVKLEFTMPEALTKWKFMGFAHDRNLKSGYLQDDVVTVKELMVQPNPPRFLREGDVLEFTVKVTNQSPTKQVGKVRLSLADARTNAPVDAPFGNTLGDQEFDIPTGESRSFSWKLTVPDGAYPITYKAVGATDRLSDGEEGMLPVLSKRILVTESIPLPIRGIQTKTFEFKKLQDAAKSNTLKHQSLTVQMTSQPAWYAVLALPYLMESQHECSEQIFNRLYANVLARHVAAGDPKIRRVFDVWKNLQPEALKSPLEKNQDVKSVILDETPWLRDAVKESEARRNVGILFDENRLNEETTRGLKKLAEMQRDNGMWPWFPGGPDNQYLSLYIVTGFGRVRHLGVKIDMAPAVKALTRLDAWMDEQYKWILTHSKDPEGNHLSSLAALYLYGRSFFLQDKPIAKEHQTAIDYWQRQAKKYWLQLANRQSQAHIALGLKRFGDKDTPKAIMASIKERSVANEEMGMFWRDTEQSWWWYHAPIETQAVMIEAFDEVLNDAKSVEDCKVWLLKQKQTQNWKTTKATADAVYALLLRGDNLLKSDALVEVTLGNEAIKPENVEAGTGFYEQKFLRTEVKPDFGKITVKKTDPGVSWGSVHWQYLEDVSKITVHDGTPLKLEKKLFKRTFTKKGPVLEEVKGAVTVGDEIVCRVILRTDRDMEYVHLKDHRGSGTEPVNVLSQYKFQDGLYYYESTKDTASHFFIDYLPKGVYVFEYAVRVQHKGQYPTGLANIQCMYAPEFNSHSESIMLEVK